MAYGQHYPPRDVHGAGPSHARMQQPPSAQNYAQYPSPTDAFGSYLHLTGLGPAEHQIGYMYYPPPSSHSEPSPPSRTTYNDVVNSFVTIDSDEYPDLHFMLARDSVRTNNFVYDVGKKPRDAIPAPIYESYRDLWISSKRPKHVRIVIDGMPWTIDIKVPIPSEASSTTAQVASASSAPTEVQEHGVTCGDVWKALYHGLRQPLMDSEMAIVNMLSSRTDERMNAFRRELMDKARRRSSRGDNAVVLRRIDWLGAKTLFVGLRKDENSLVSDTVLLPGRRRCEDTWVAEFTFPTGQYPV